MSQDKVSSHDDVFDEDSGDDPIELEKREWERMIDARQKEGYREGIAAGQEVTLQQGFNRGYTESFSRTFKLARYRGILCAYCGEQTLKKVPSNEDLLSDAERMIERISDLEKRICDGNKSSGPNDDDEPQNTVAPSDRECDNSACGKDVACKTNTSVSESKNFLTDISCLEKDSVSVIGRLSLSHLL